MRRLPAILSILLAAAPIVLTAEEPAVLVPAAGAIPDLTQTDPAGNFAGGGKGFCGPVAVSNSLMAIYRRDFEWDDFTQYDLVNQLASRSFMLTDVEKGTEVVQLLRGVDLFLEERGEKNYYLRFQGWQSHDKWHRTGVNDPQIAWVKSILARGGAVWLNVGWYGRTAEEGSYRRFGGHWVTAVGYGADEDGQAQPDILVIHDPAPRAGLAPRAQFVTMTRMESGKLNGPLRNLPRPARGLYKLEGGMRIKRGADLAILDGAVGLVLNRRTP